MINGCDFLTPRQNNSRWVYMQIIVRILLKQYIKNVLTWRIKQFSVQFATE